MKQQWQQMTDQQKKLAIVLIVVIVLAVALIVWQLMPKRPSTAISEAGQQPLPSIPASPMPGSGSSGTMGTGSPEFEPEMIGQAGMPTMSGGWGPTPSTTEAGAPTTLPPGKLETPPRPGRLDPFGDLPAKKVEPFVPIVLPPTPEPVVIAKTQASSIGTETFSLSDITTNIPPLQAQSVNLRSYFVSPQPVKTGPRELLGWRLAGTILTEGSVGAIVQTPDGRSQAIRLGGRVSHEGNDYVVTQIDEQKVILKDSRGEEYILTRKPATVTPPPFGGAYAMPQGFGQFGPGGY